MNSIDEIKKIGFTGFQKISELKRDISVIPKEKGVYLVLYTKKEHPSFMETGTGGYFKGKNPNVAIEDIKQKWVNGAIVVYIGKAGGLNSKATLLSRIKQYLAFGQGQDIGHYGGRYIWQMKDSDNLLICWKVLADEEPREAESELISDFITRYNKMPFANLLR